MTYEELLIEADSNNICVLENLNFESDSYGLINGDVIGINQSVKTSSHKACVLAEEMAHYYVSSGNIIDTSDTSSRKQEIRARLYAFDKQIGLRGIISAFKARCINLCDIAEHLNVTEEFLTEALECYRSKYGIATSLDNYVIGFEPVLYVMERFE